MEMIPSTRMLPAFTTTIRLAPVLYEENLLRPEMKLLDLYNFMNLVIYSLQPSISDSSLPPLLKN